MGLSYKKVSNTSRTIRINIKNTIDAKWWAQILTIVFPWLGNKYVNEQNSI